MEIIKKIGFKDKDGDVVWRYVEPALYLTAAIAIVVIFIYVAGKIMKILTMTVKEYKALQAARNLPIGAVRVA